MVVVADTAGWIAAIAGAVGAVVVVATGAAALKRFRLELEARIDERRQAIWLDLENRGRAGGRVKEVAVIDPDEVEIPAEFAGLAGGRVKAAELPGRSSRHLIINAVQADGPFRPDARVRVVSGRSREHTVVPRHVEGRSYYGEESDWPT